MSVVSLSRPESELSATSVGAIVTNADPYEVDGGSAINNLTINGNDTKVEPHAIENREIVGTRNRVTIR